MFLSFPYGATTIEFEVIFRKRKTMAIRVDAQQKITTFAPLGTSKKQILNRMRTSAPWIMKKLQMFNAMEPYRPKEYVDGERFLHLGTKYPLQISLISGSGAAKVELGQNLLIVQTPNRDENIIKMAIETWYRQEARKVITERVEYYLPIIGKAPNRIVIKEQKKRWGSCSSRGNLNFNWKTIMAPQSVVDYVVVHEMCHMVYLNHSREFWGQVEQILPDYRQQKSWLDHFGLSLSL
ncbi:MAG TPA: SprT family zinc-dependent metalloprotease [Syntrophomonadaceae bacterium]|nr:SprT family zinc-dependent metalloprotease [Syntrophomonadaceae bacterium]